LDYAHAMTRLPELIQDVQAASLQDGSHLAELEELTRSVPRLIGQLPTIVRDPTDARHHVAVATMITGLTRQLDRAMPLAFVSWPHNKTFSPIVFFF
jgi:nuclear pore complex protein Nup98-Nup96